MFNFIEILNDGPVIWVGLASGIANRYYASTDADFDQASGIRNSFA
ncbi:MAG: hypothetical protein AAFO87_13985 [Cyanobacteria bacterium J06607_6]